MKKFTLLAIAALLSVVAFAQKQRFVSQPQTLQRTTLHMTPATKHTNSATDLYHGRRVQGVDELIELPADATVETYYTKSGNFYAQGSSGFVDATGEMPSINVATSGTDVYIQGLAYWFPESWIKGTLNGNTVTFANGQYIGEDKDGPEYIVGTNDGGKTMTDVVFTLDTEAGLLTAVTTLIVESASNTKIQAYCYWAEPVFTTEEPEIPDAVTPPAGLVTTEMPIKGTIYTANDESIPVDATITVGFDGTDVYFQGLIPEVPEGWAKGELKNGVVTFKNGQNVGSDAEGTAYYMWGYKNGLGVTDVTFTYDAEANLFISQTFIFGSTSATTFTAYQQYYAVGLIIGVEEEIELVTPPANLQTSEYVYTATGWYYTSAGNSEVSVARTAYVGFDGNDVYIQGLDERFNPDGWVKGTLADGKIVVKAGQLIQAESAGEIFDLFFQGTEPDGNSITDIVFAYDAEKGVLTAENDIYVTGDRHSLAYYHYYQGAVLQLVNDVAAMPANPEIVGAEETDYGWVISFDVPSVDVDGNLMSLSKLSYELFTETDGVVAPLTFTSATHIELTEDMTEIPFGFTENYDFYSDHIYLNELYSEDWDKIGIKSIYRGGGAVNETEIQWFDLAAARALQAAFDELYDAIIDAQALAKTPDWTEGLEDFQAAIAAAIAAYQDEDATVESLTEALEVLTEASVAYEALNNLKIAATWVAGDQGYANEEELGEEQLANFITAQFAVGTGTVTPKYYTSGKAARVYAGNTITITASEYVERITAIQFVCTNASYNRSFTVDGGTYTKSGANGIWTGDAKTITFTNGESGQARIKSIDIKYEITEEGTGITTVETVSIPVGAVYNMQGQRLSDKPQKGLYIMNGKKYMAK